MAQDHPVRSKSFHKAMKSATATPPDGTPRLPIQALEIAASLCPRVVPLPLVAKVEVSYQCDFNPKADNDNKPK